MASERLSIKSSINVGKLVEAVSDTEVQILISVDSYQAQMKPEDRHYSIEILYPEHEGKIFQEVEL